MKMKLTISVVTFNNEAVIEKALTSIRQSTLAGECRVIVVDNSSADKTAEIIAAGFPWVTLIHSENIGFGAGHNKAIKQILGKSRYHLVMNPDVYFTGDVLEKLIAFMEEHEDVGLVMPKILYPDEGKGERIQYLCKQLPTPLDLIGRRFLPGFIKSLPPFKKRFDRYESRDRDYNEIMAVPHLSGCFMMLRAGVFETVGLFDERFFMYLEDVDFSRRVGARYKTMYYPNVSIYHQYHKGSYKRFKHLKYHIISAVKYFNKWGWFK
jgi:GT2 family glycosyltransferase